MSVFRFVPGYEQHVVEPGKEPLFLLLVAFALTRLYTRLARVRGWGSGNVGGVHLHHVVPGIVLVLVAGLLLSSPAGDSAPLRELAAIALGAGAALVVDEFALVLHLRDVYWSREGRSSVDAAIIGALLAGLLLVVSSPFGLEDDADPGQPRVIAFAVVALNLVAALASFAKGKRFLGTAAVFVPVLGWIGATRLAKPGSPWARRFYPGRPAKHERSVKRFGEGKLGRLERAVADFVGGKLDGPSAS